MTTESIASTAYELDVQIHAANFNIRANFLVLARLLCKMRDEKLYRVLDHPTFESDLGTLGAEGNRAWLYKLCRAWELFSKKLGVPDARLIEAGPSKLDIIAPVVNEENKDEWLNKTELSKSDLIQEVRSHLGKPPLSSLKVPAGQISRTGQISYGIAGLLSKYPTYLDYVRGQPCIVCGSTQVDASHFPKTRGAGAPDEWAVPACRKCHGEYHLNPLKWMHDYQDKWAAYYYGLILKIWETA
jgi:hypothetical protein